MKKLHWILWSILLVVFILISGHHAHSTQFKNESCRKITENQQEKIKDVKLLLPYHSKTKNSSLNDHQNSQKFIEENQIGRTNAANLDQIIKNENDQQMKEKPLQQAKEQPQSGKPIVYLTFDDGPNQYLNQILDILNQKKAKGTFFLIEPQIWHYQDAVKRLVREGNYPGLHSVSHDVKKVYKSPDNFINEMEQTRKTLYKVTGIDSKLIRAPYGSKPYMTVGFRNAAFQHGFKMWDWNIDTLDWKFQRTNPHQIVVNALNGLERMNKKNAIVILMHVTKGTATVLPQIIDYLYSKGYQCPAYNPNKLVMMNFWNDPRL